MNEPKLQNTRLSSPTTSVKSCPALISKIIPPKVLLLGETASPLPDEGLTLAYQERSMWKVLAEVFHFSHSSSEQLATCKNDDYQLLKETVLSRGIAIWDVLSNVHKKKHRGGCDQTRGGQTMPTESPNDLIAFLDAKGARACCFIGANAYQTFLRRFTKKQKRTSKPKVYVTPSGISIDLVVLPRSSMANRMPLTEKAAKWKDVLNKYNCGIR